MTVSILRENVYLPKLSLPQMAPMDVKRVRQGAKEGFGNPWCRTILNSTVGITQNCTSPIPMWQRVVWAKCGSN